MTSDTLAVLVCGKRAGTCTQRPDGTRTFAYEDGYSGIPLSLSMPVSNMAYGEKTVLPYLEGLLPENQGMRRRLGREYGISGGNPFALLRYMGMDCPGAVQFCSESEVENVPSRNESYEPLSEAAIEDRLARLNNSDDATWQGDDEHWSLGGQQAKIAVAFKDGAWFRCTGAAATTHIIKPGISHLKHQALDEYLCLKLATACSIPSANAEYRAFGSQPAIVIARYDRARTPEGNTMRLHQEDFCQALGVLPQNKYPSEGGPSARDIVCLLKANKGAERNVPLFVEMLFFNYLVGAPDAHAKNYSILLGREGRVALAPLYDVASGLAYDPPRGGWKLAMGIGQETSIGHVRRSNLVRFARNCNLDADECCTLMANLAERISMRADSVFDAAQGISGCDELRERMEPAIIALCGNMLDAL